MGFCPLQCSYSVVCTCIYENNPERTDFGEWAKGQMEYLMGRNPMGYSYIVGYGYEKDCLLQNTHTTELPTAQRQIV